MMFIPLLVGGAIFFIDTLNLLPNFHYSFIFTGMVSICGLILTLIVVPLFFRNCFINWKNSNTSWKWQLSLIPIIFIIGNILILPSGFFLVYLIPINIFILGISTIVALILTLKLNHESSFIYFLLVFLILILSLSIYLYKQGGIKVAGF